MTVEQIREKACIAYTKWLPETHPEVIENEDEYEEYSNGLVEGWYGGYEQAAKELQDQIKQSNERIKIMIDEKEKLEDANEKLWEREDEFKKDFETLLKKLMDRKVLKSWYYNGTFHYEFQED